MYTVKTTNQFDKNLRLMKKRGYDIALLTDVVKKLANGEILPPHFRDHALTGNWNSYRELHIKPDWLLIYRYEKNVLILTLTATGTHSDLFGK
ncbi:MAG: type II toxin-antitoxin system YafQ family toxin [Treponema sp.]|nr:type II toxin-antitoxin system YafQ family toxin [Treponema sp.]